MESADSINDQDRSDQNLKTVEVAGSKDWFLSNIVVVAANSGIEFSITLNVAGLIVSGTLIGGSKYFNLLGDSILSAGGNSSEVRDALGNGWKQFAAIYDRQEDEGADGRVEPVAYIHLEDAHIYSPDGGWIPTNEGLLWRGKISSVDGFSVGKFG